MRLHSRLAYSPLIVWLVATSLPKSTHAAQVVIAVTGTVASGNDVSGVFGAQNGDLTGNAFTLVFTFDDTQGNQTTANCGGMPYQTTITSTPTSNPGIATLTIGGKSFTFGVLNASYEANSETYRSYASNSSCSANSLIYLSVGDGYLGNGSGINGFVEPADGTILTSSPNWEAPFSDSNLYANPNNDYTISFEISELPTSGQYVSDGFLIPQTITVSGPESCQVFPPRGSVDLSVETESTSLSPGPIRPPRRPLECTPASVPPSDIPISETTTWWGWDNPDLNGSIGDYGIGVWHAHLNDINPSNTSNFNGGTVHESSPSNGTDSCYFATSQYTNRINIAASGMPTTSPVGVNGFNNDWEDAVGWTAFGHYDGATYIPDPIDYYRQQNAINGIPSIPCGFTIYQQMSYKASDGKFYDYGTVNILQGTINASTVSSSRAGQTKTH